MPLTYTPAPALGTKAKDFSLTGVDGKTYTLKDVAGKNGTLVMFISNHCPFVKTIAGRLADDMKVLQAKDIGVVAIMSNDTAAYPADSFDNMKAFSAQHGFTFPYVIDETQDVARNYGAVCTPDFFGYNAAGELQFRGRLDEVNPSKAATPDTKKELVEALLLIAATGKGPAQQTPSMGCNIKWKSAQAA
jgi:peroxiredoxin